MGVWCLWVTAEYACTVNQSFLFNLLWLLHYCSWMINNVKMSCWSYLEEISIFFAISCSPIIKGCAQNPLQGLNLGPRSNHLLFIFHRSMSCSSKLASKASCASWSVHRFAPDWNSSTDNGWLIDWFDIWCIYNGSVQSVMTWRHQLIPPQHLNNCKFNF